MNLKNIFPPKIKNASVLLTFVLISGLLFSSQTSSNYLSNFFADFVGSISTNKTEVCIDESATITFKGENGTAPYTFTYEVNGLEQTVTSIGDTKTLSVNTTTVGDFKYKLTKVEDSSVSSLVVTPNKEVTIKVIATPIPNFTITNNNACSGETVQFINTSTGDDLTYKWEFGDGNISTLENPSNIYNNLFGCDKTDFTVKLTVTNKNNCSSTFNNVVTILHKPAFEIKDVDSPFDHFNYCSNSPTDDFNINVGLKSFDTCLSTYDIDWGDGNIENNISFPINHLYAKLGGYTMLITGTSTNGCKTVLETTVRKGSDPSGGFPSPGGIDNLCIPVNIEFGISGWHGNSNNTTYVVDFGDGSPIETYTQTELDEYSTLNPTSDKFPTPHEYTISSCDTDTGKFFPRVTITNPCDEKSFGPDDGISILKKPELGFSWDENTCLDTPITFYNNSISGNGKDCSISGEYTWDFGDGTPTVTTEDITPTPHTYTSPGKYTVTLSAFSYCNQTDSVKVEKEICIETKTTADFSVDNNEGCIPLAVTATNTIDKTDICSEPTYNWNVNYAPNNCSSSSSFSFTNGTNSTSENPQFIFNNPGKYTITQIVTNLCGTETKSQVIDVKKPPTVSINNIVDACGSITINPTAIIENCTTDTSALTYKWTFPGGLPTTATTLNPGDIVYSTSGVYEVTLEVTNDCGISNKATESFEVLEIPIITNTNLTQEICSGETTSEIVLTSDKTGTTYSWSAVASSVGISGFTTNGNSNTIPSQTLTNTLNSVETVTYTATPTLNTCVGDPVDFVITVYPTLIIKKQPISSEICLDGTATELEVAYLNGTGTASYQWYSNSVDDTSTGTQIPGETNATYNPPTDTIGTTYYYAIISFTSGGCTEIISDTASVIVVEQLTIAPVSNPQTVCIGGTADKLSITYSGGTGNATYQWYSNTTNSNTGGSAITGEINSEYTPVSFSTDGIFYYYVEVSLDGNGCSLAKSDVFIVNVLEDPIIDAQPIVSQELCQNATPDNLTVTVSGGTSSPKTYQWYQNTTNSNSGGTQITGEISDTLIPNTANVGTFYYYVMISQPEADCAITSNVSTLIIKPAPIFTKQPVASEICLDGTATELEVAYLNGTGTASYQWYSNSVDDTSTGTEITGEIGATYIPTTNTVGTTYYYAVISFTSGGCTEIISDTASVIVNQQLTVTSVTTPQYICAGGTADKMKVTYSGGAGIDTYQWFSNTTNSNTGGSAITGEISSEYTPISFSTDGIFYYYVEVSLDGNGCSLAKSDVFIVNVLKDPIIDAQPIASQELCQNATPDDLTVTVSGGTSSPKTYQWYVNTDSATDGSSVVPGATSATYTPPTDTVGSLFYYVVVTQAESGCSVESEVSVIKINEAPEFKKQPISSEICLDGTATLLEVTYQNGTGTASYQWYSNSVDDTSTGTQIPGETNATYNPPTNTIGTTYYYAIISFTSGGCTEIISDTASVIVVEQLTIAPVSNPQTVCIGGTADKLSITYSGGTGNATYQWYSNTTNSNTGGSAITGEINSEYTPVSFSTDGIFYYYVEVSLDGNGCSLAKSDVFIVNVLEDPIIDAQPIVSQELCQNATPVDLTVTVSGGTSSPKTYQWYQNTTNSNSGGTQITGEISDTLIPNTANVGTFYYYVMISQPEADCAITSNVSTLIIKPAPIFTKQPVASEICLDGTATELEVAYLNGTGTASYQWYSNSVDDTSTGTEITGEIGATYIPTTNTVGTTYYYAVISFTSGGCTEIISDTASVIVNQIPVINFAEITTYSKVTFNFDPKTDLGNTVPIGTKYIWATPTFNPAGAIIGATEQTIPQDEISQTLENTGNTPIIVTYTITPATATCVGDDFILEVTVNPNIKSNAIVTNISCFEENDGSISTNIVGGIPFETGSPYLTSWIGPNGFTSNSANITDLEAGTYTLIIEDKEGYTFSQSYTITQPKILSITKDIEKNISCFNGNDGAIEVTISGGTLPYNYNWTTVDGSGILPNVEKQNKLTAGNYTLEIIDKNNCTISTNVILTQPEGLKIEVLSKQDILCFGDASGTIEINVTGGTEKEISTGIFDYLYSWSGPNGFTSTSKNINNLIAGTYVLDVTDNLGCSTSTSILIQQSSEIKITYTKTDVTCYGENNGNISVSVTGGLAPYKISWSNLANGFSQSNLSADTYIATVTDKNNCVKDVSITIEQPIFYISPTVSPISCNDENDGSISLNVTGGISPITVVWSDDATAGVQRNNLAAGTYTVLITDIGTCPIEETFIITNPPKINVTSSYVDAINCNIANSGSINLDISGGTKPYSFLWNTGETTKDLNNIPPGDYSVEITDASGCSVNRQFNIFRQEPINITLNETIETDCSIKKINTITEPKVTGGFLPYKYSWSAGTTSGPDNAIMTTSQNGAYTLTVTDNNGCTATKSLIIDVPTIGIPDFKYNAFAIDKYDLLSINDPIQFTNLSTGLYSEITWNFGDGTPIIKEENPVHTYDQVGEFKITLSIEYDAGCTETVERTVTITKGYLLISPNAFTPNGDGHNETIRPSHRGLIEIEMTIFNTWGTSIYYEKGNNLIGWDGMIKGNPAENGNYIMVVKGLTFYNKEIVKTSPLTLLK